MGNKKYFALFIVSTVFTVIWGLISLVLILYASPAASRTYYPSHYWGGMLLVFAIFVALLLMTVAFFRKSKGKKVLLFFIVGFVLLALSFCAQQYTKHYPEQIVEKQFGFRVMPEKTYSVNGLEYKVPANWKKDMIQTGEGWEYRYHYPNADISFERGYYLFYGFDVEFTDNDFTGDYRAFMEGWFGGGTKYRILNTEYVLNEKFNSTALKQECTATVDGKDCYYIIYLVEDRTNNKMYMVSYQKVSGELSVWNRADFDRIIDNLD